MRLSLKTVLTASFLFVAFIAMGQGTISVLKLGEIGGRASAVASDWLPSVDQAWRIGATASQVRLKQYRLVSSSKTPEQLADNLAQLDQTMKALTATIEAYPALISSEDERSLFEQFRAEWAKYLQNSAAIVGLASAGQGEIAFQILVGKETLDQFNR